MTLDCTVNTIMYWVRYLYWKQIVCSYLYLFWIGFIIFDKDECLLTTVEEHCGTVSLSLGRFNRHLLAALKYDVDEIDIDINTCIARDIVIYTGYSTALIINIDIDITKEATKQWQYQYQCNIVRLAFTRKEDDCCVRSSDSLEGWLLCWTIRLLAAHGASSHCVSPQTRRLIAVFLLEFIRRLIVVLVDTFVGTACRHIVSPQTRRMNFAFSPRIHLKTDCCVLNVDRSLARAHLPTIYIPTPLQYVVPLLVLSNDRPPPLGHVVRCHKLKHEVCGIGSLSWWAQGGMWNLPKQIATGEQIG